MKRLKNMSLFRITLLIILNILLNNIFIFSISVLYLLIDNYKELIVFISLLFLLNTFNSINSDYIRYGIVESKENNYVIVDKILYKTKVYDEELEVGDFVKFLDKSDISTNEYELKHNIKYTYNSTYLKLFEFKLRKLINTQINSFDDKTNAYLNRIILNKYTLNEEIEDIGYGFSFYYLLILIKKKKPKLSYALILIYIFIFGFDVKFYLLLSEIIISFFDVNRIEKLSLKLIFILFINKQLIYNFSIIISLLLSLYYTSELSADKSYIAIFQSLLFNQIQLFTLFFYKYLMYIRVFMFIVSIFTLLIPNLSVFYTMIIEFIAFILKHLNYGIRGKISILLLIILLMTFKLFKINNQYIKISLILLCLITPINNPFKHVTFINVGQGDSTLIKGFMNSYNVLIDTGSTYNYSKLKNELYGQGVYRIDYLIITHSDTDHSGNIDNLNKDFNIKEIVDKGKYINLNNESLVYIDIGKSDNDNDNSLVYLLKIDDYKFLFTGDVSSKVENQILKYDEALNIDVLKVSHHGSNSATSKYFLGLTKPKFSIISTSGAYNHPSKKVINNLDSYYVKTFITKNDGSISFYFTKIIDFIKTSINDFVII